MPGPSEQVRGWWTATSKLFRQHRTAAISGVVVVAVLVALVAIPRGGGDKNRAAHARAGAPEEQASGETTSSTAAGDTTTTSIGATVTTRRPRGATAAGPGGTAVTVSTIAPGGPIGVTRGVTATTIKIGVALPDLEAFGKVSENFNVGDQRKQMDSILAGWKKEAIVPTSGRTIQFVYRDYDILSSDEKIAACQGFIEDDKVFAVMAGRFFGEGAECVTSRFKTPLVTITSDLAPVYQRSAPWFYTVRPTWDRLFANWVDWATTGGHVKKTDKIGLFYEDEIGSAVESGIKNEFKARGYQIASEVHAAGAGLGTSEDRNAVLKFCNDKVNKAFLVVGGTSALNFMSFAKGQHDSGACGRWTYIATDYGEHPTDAATSVYPESEYDGAVAMTTTRIGEIKAGMGLAPETSRCLKWYQDYGGTDIKATSPESAAYNNLVVSCDMANTMLTGIRAAGSGLGQLSLVRGLDSVQGLPLAAHESVGFTGSRHHGVESERTVRWAAACKCWSASGSFRRFTL